MIIKNYMMNKEINITIKMLEKTHNTAVMA